MPERRTVPAGRDLPLRRQLALACRVVAMEGHNDAIWGHVSVRRPGEDVFWIKAAGMGLEEATAANVQLIDLDGRRLLGPGIVHTELPIHSEIYRRRPEVGAVVHTHPVFATVLGAAGHRIRPVTHEGALFFPPDIPLFDQTTDLILTRELGEAVAAALGDQPALLLKNHGIVVAGRTLEEAACWACLLEKGARAQVFALALGAPAWTGAEEALLKRKHIYHDQALAFLWQYYCRKLRRQGMLS
ncbi:MAG: class II aldolase/adducin family protein [Deltaproteobacteria bacterium]|nr:class II aldolase/adducin family protein [Deltaproteobacteria bacterium]